MPTLYTVTRCGIVYKYTVPLKTVREFCWNAARTLFQMARISTHYRVPMMRTVVVAIAVYPKSHNRTRRPVFYYP